MRNHAMRIERKGGEDLHLPGSIALCRPLSHIPSTDRTRATALDETKAARALVPGALHDTRRRNCPHVREFFMT